MKPDCWPGAMRLKPESAEEVNECADPRGMRKRIIEYSYHGNEVMVKAILDAARYRGLSGEDTMTWLAFEALQGMERFKEILLDNAALIPNAPLFIRAERERSK